MLYRQSLRYIIRHVGTKEIMKGFDKVLSVIICIIPFQAKLTVPPGYIFPKCTLPPDFERKL